MYVYELVNLNFSGMLELKGIIDHDQVIMRKFLERAFLEIKCLDLPDEFIDNMHICCLPLYQPKFIMVFTHDGAPFMISEIMIENMTTYKKYRKLETQEVLLRFTDAQDFVDEMFSGRNVTEKQAKEKPEVKPDKPTDKLKFKYKIPPHEKSPKKTIEFNNDEFVQIK